MATAGEEGRHAGSPPSIPVGPQEGRGLLPSLSTAPAQVSACREHAALGCLLSWLLSWLTLSLGGVEVLLGDSTAPPRSSGGGKALVSPSQPSCPVASGQPGAAVFAPWEAGAQLRLLQSRC